MLDGTKTPKRRQNHVSCSTTRWLSLHGSMHGRGLDTFCQEELATAARDVECTTLGPMKLLSICRSRLVAQLALSRLQNPAQSCSFQYASWSESLLGGGPFIVLRSRGNIYIANSQAAKLMKELYACIILQIRLSLKLT